MKAGDVALLRDERGRRCAVVEVVALAYTEPDPSPDTTCMIRLVTPMIDWSSYYAQIGPCPALRGAGASLMVPHQQLEALPEES